MKRREFIINTALTLGGTALASAGFAKENLFINDGQVVKRKFKDIEIPLAGFSSMLFPMQGQKIDVVEVDNIIDYCMKHGANYFDSSYMYLGGEAEKVLGKSLSRYKRQDFILASKCPINFTKTREDVRKIFEEQCRRCQVDYFDLYMCQNIGQNTYDVFKQVSMYDELLKLKKEGKIKYLGFSFLGTPDILSEVVNNYKWDFCQLRINYFDWDIANAKKQYEIAQKAGLPIAVMEPLRLGELDNLRGKAKEKLNELYPDTTPAEFALRWAASKSGVITVLSSMRKFQEVKQDIDTFVHFKEMTKGEEKVANEITKIIQSQGKINCISCTSCMKVCPRKIEIPTIFSIYNKYKVDNDKTKFSKKYESIKESARADKCIKCGACKRNCPQSLDIPNLLEKINNEYQEIKKKESK